MPLSSQNLLRRLGDLGSGTCRGPRRQAAGRGKSCSQRWSSIRYSDDVYQREVRDVLAETTSDAAGRFQFEDVESLPFRSFGDRSPWDLVALADGFALGWVHIDAAKRDIDITVQLQPSKAIRGRLIDANDNPIAGCIVQVGTVDAPGSDWQTDFSDPMRFDLWRSQLAPQATTDAEGNFELTGLPANQRITLVAQHPDFVHHYFISMQEQRTNYKLLLRKYRFVTACKRPSSGRSMRQDSQKS